MAKKKKGVQKKIKKIEGVIEKDLQRDRDLNEICKDGSWITEIGRDPLTSVVMRLQKKRTERDAGLLVDGISRFIHKYSSYYYFSSFRYQEEYTDTYQDIFMEIWKRIFVFNPKKKVRFITYVHNAVYFHIMNKIHKMDSLAYRPKDRHGNLLTNISLENIGKDNKRMIEKNNEEFNLDNFMNGFEGRLKKSEYNLLFDILVDENLKSGKANLSCVCRRMSRLHKVSPHTMRERIVKKIRPYLLSVE